MQQLTVEKREKGAKLAEGKVPAVFYGPKEESTPVTVNLKEFTKVWKEAGESSVIQLEGIGEEKDALIKAVDVHPVTGILRHADFYVFERGKKVQVAVPIVFVGESPAEKGLGGTLVKVMHELEIEARPSQLPHEVEVDVSVIVDFEVSVHVKDIKLPEGVEAMADPDDTVVLANEPKEEEEEEEVTEIDMDAIEAEGEKKEGEEGEEGEKPAEDKGGDKKEK